MAHEAARAGSRSDAVARSQDAACLAACCILNTDHEADQDALAWSRSHWQLGTRGPSELELKLFECSPGDPVMFLPGNRFEFARDARDPSEAVAAIVLAAPDELGQLTDLAAWEPETGRMALLLGRVSMLGQDNLYGWRLCEPLLMHDTPLEWLMAGREGVFVIDPERASPLLRAVEPLGVQSPEFGRQIQAALTIRAPRILVATRRRAP